MNNNNTPQLIAILQEFEKLMLEFADICEAKADALHKEIISR